MKDFTIKLIAGTKKPDRTMTTMPQYFYVRGYPIRRPFERYARLVKSAADKISADYREEQLRIALSNPN